MYTSVANLYTPEAIAQTPTGRVINVHYDGTGTEIGNRNAIGTGKKQIVKKRVAAYCRVSTDSDEQLGSLENQMEAFRHQVTLHDDWELVGLYTDEGISGTSTNGYMENLFKEIFATRLIPPPLNIRQVIAS